MRSVALLVALFIMTMGAAGVIAPEALIAVGRYVATPVGLYVVAALRVGIGLVLLLVAPVSAAPRTLRVLGAFVLVAGLATPFFGVDRTQATFAWALSQGTALIRLGAGLLLVLGSVVAVAVARGRRRA